VSAAGPWLPLHGLFRALRDAGLPLGVADYLALLSALRQGEGADRAALLRLCKMLWTSSLEEGQTLERLFRASLPPELMDADVPPDLRAIDAGAEIDEPVAPPTQKAPSLPPETPAGGPETPSGAEDTARIQTPFPAGDRAVGIAAATVQASVAKLDPALVPRRLAAGEYLPVTPRQLGQSWRRLRRLEARGPRTELDLPATMESIARTGLAASPVLAARRVNVAHLLLLLDRDGSMAPFHPLIARLTDTALHGGGLRHVDVASFHNHALDTIVRPSGPAPLRDLLDGLPPGAVALIASDAGAARGGIEAERIETTRRMLALVGSAARHVVWINPCPRRRWPGTSAEEIAALVPMFEATRAGFDAAVRVLRGRRPFTHGAPAWPRP
jgi:uncharacterized protein with von Willebrand factor type A (vWA) domain